MRLRFLETSDAREATYKAAVELGPNSVVVEDQGEDGAPVFAGLVEKRQEEDGTDQLIDAVLVHHVVSERMRDAMRAVRGAGGDAETALTQGLQRIIQFTPLPSASRTRIMLVGPPAAGKSTAAAKLAARSTRVLPAIMTTDVDRPGGIEQLSQFTSQIGIEPLGLRPGMLPPVSRGPVIVDTAGLESGNETGFRLLGDIALALKVEPVLVLSALGDTEEAAAYAEAAKAIGARRLLITRLDMARRLDGVLAAAECGLALAGGSITPHFAFGFKALSAQLLAHRMIDLLARSKA